ncbi:MAG: TonB-dependent receptor plug domain-containing protein [Congregibacter sp.]
MKLFRVETFCGACLCLTGLLTQTTAWGQALEEVVVTAERRAGNLQSTPIAVSAFTSDQLEKLRVTETLEVADNVPKLVLYTGVSNPGMVNLYMRGAGEQIGGLVTSESAVGLYVDDVYNARLSAANFDLVDIEV